jgi:hypothetical protein
MANVASTGPLTRATSGWVGHDVTMTEVMTAEGSAEDTRRHLFKEAATMGLYVAVCLLAGLMAVPDDADPSDVEVLGLVWGTAVGLAIAHWFAFEVSARLVAGGRLEAGDGQIALAQVVAAVFVAVLTTVPVILLPEGSEFDVARLVLAGAIAAAGYGVARGAGGTVFRSSVYAGVTLAAGVAVAAVKNILSGH